MSIYDVQVATDTSQEFVLQVSADSEAEAEMTAIAMVEAGDTEYGMCTVVDCFCL